MANIIIATLAQAKTYAETLRAFNTLKDETVPEIRAEMLRAIEAGILDPVRDAEHPNRFYLFGKGNERGEWITKVDAVEGKTVVDTDAIAKAWKEAHGETLDEMAARWYAENIGNLPTKTTSGRRATVNCEHQTKRK